MSEAPFPYQVDGNRAAVSVPFAGRYLTPTAPDDREPAPLPATIVVGPYRYAVVDDKPFTDSHDAWGFIQYAAQRIVYDASAAPERLRVALMHEVLHAIHDLVNTRGEKWEEGQVTQDAGLLVDVLRRNPALVAFLIAGADAAPAAR